MAASDLSYKPVFDILKAANQHGLKDCISTAAAYSAVTTYNREWSSRSDYKAIPITGTKSTVRAHFLCHISDGHIKADHPLFTTNQACLQLNKIINPARQERGKVPHQFLVGGEPTPRTVALPTLGSTSAGRFNERNSAPQSHSSPLPSGPTVSRNARDMISSMTTLSPVAKEKPVSLSDITALLEKQTTALTNSLNAKTTEIADALDDHKRSQAVAIAEQSQTLNEFIKNTNEKLSQVAAQDEVQSLRSEVQALDKKLDAQKSDTVQAVAASAEMKTVVTEIIKENHDASGEVSKAVSTATAGLENRVATIETSDYKKTLEENRLLIEGLYKTIDKLVKEPCEASIMGYAAQWENGCAEYRKSVTQNKRAGILRMVIIDKTLFRKIGNSENVGEHTPFPATDSRLKPATTDSTSGTATRGPEAPAASTSTAAAKKSEKTVKANGFEIKADAIATVMGSSWKGFGKPNLTYNGFLACTIRLDGQGRFTYEAVSSILENRKSCKGKLALSLPAPAGHVIDSALLGWKRSKLIVKYDTTRSGFYVLYLRDGDGEPTEPLTETYIKSCSRLNLSNPNKTVELNEPTIGKLRLIIKGEHFVHNGKLYKFPAGHRKGRVVNYTLSEHGKKYDEDIERTASNDSLTQWKAAKDTYGANTTFNWSE